LTTLFPGVRLLVLRRSPDCEPPLARGLAHAVAALGEFHGGARMTYAGDPPHPIEPDEATLGALLAEVRRDWRAGVPEIFMLVDAPEEPRAQLFLNIEETPVGPVAAAWSTVPDVANLESMMDGVSAVAHGFGAEHAHLEDDQLLTVYRGARSVERGRSTLPPELRQYVPELAHPHVSSTIPQLLVPQEFDVRRVPDAVWWVNFWGRIQVDAVGRDRVAAAPWARLVEQPNDALLLAATEEPTDVERSDHAAALATLVTALGLRELQERFQYSEDGW
jgi:hypothetical protein